MEDPLDRLAKKLASSVSRRDALRIVGRGLAGILLASFGLEKRTWAADDTCPDCGACQACDFAGGTCDLPCIDPCTASVLCREASKDIAFRQLTDFLDSEGFMRDGEPYAMEFRGQEFRGQVSNRSAVITPYVNQTTGETAMLGYGVEATGETGTYAIVSQSRIPQYVLAVGSDEQVERIPIAGNVDGFTPDPNNPFNCDNCVPYCKFAVAVSCAVLGVGFAAVSLGVAVLAAVAFAGLCTLLSEETCEQDVCGPLTEAQRQEDEDNCGRCGNLCPRDFQCIEGRCQAPTQRVYCRCNRTCYDSATECTSNCRTSLGCFTDICRPALPGEC